eukprot:TRINITY_DN4868_c0_g1_i1.p1 TRINITY_DN4868_c0_g1~~TRINITY_DN4868_c0_g1_i1.p1  ORF type:complete len:432 (+),score=70.88 TRINITY_DN4868_c0_g1_i1:614-1909(+)
MDITGLITNVSTTPIVRQMSTAILNWVNAEQVEVDNCTVGTLRHNSILQESITQRRELEQNLEGLVWGCEIAKRGLCSVDELLILTEWINSPSKNIAVSAAKAVCDLLKRNDTEFTLTQQEISEKLLTSGCLPTLLNMAASNEIKPHTEVIREELETADKIGEGTSGVVRAGKWHGITVAIKTFNTDSNPKEFLREVSLLSLIKHKHIVALRGACTKPGDTFLIEDLMEASLYDLLHCKTIDLSEMLKLHFAYGTAKGMQVLHSLLLVHRDLKSLNILVSKDMVTKICDFGLSRVMDKSKAAMTANIGTVYWTAPEVFSKKGYSEKADIYSYGIILWELLTRERPYSDVNDFSVPVLVTRGERPAIPKNCDKEYRTLVTKCWHKQPLKRPSFDKILEKLRIMRTVGVVVAWSVGWRWCCRNGVLSGSGLQR